MRVPCARTNTGKTQLFAHNRTYQQIYWGDEGSIAWAGSFSREQEGVGGYGAAITDIDIYIYLR